MLKLNFFFSILIAFFSINAYSNSVNEQKVVSYFQQIQQDPLKLYQFLYQFPKGGELHTHFSGATYAENLINYSQGDNFCVSPTTFIVSPNSHCQKQSKISYVANDATLFNNLLSAWSMRNFIPGKESNENHFFNSFGKFGLLVSNHAGQVLAEIIKRATNQNLSYQEIMLTPYDLDLVNAQGEMTAALGRKIGWDNDLLKLREKLLAQGLKEIINLAPKKLTAIETVMRQQLQCNQKTPNHSCQLSVRYQYIALRGLNPVEVFAQLVTAFEIASIDKRFVGVNMVQAEDGPIAMRDYKLHMKMLATLHKLYPKVNISLHAGELAINSVLPEGLRFHIRDATNQGYAQRIGHGVDIMYEANPDILLAQMAKKQILVEINLTSNEILLGVKGKQHPFPLYLNQHVPVALSTDDEGVLRTYITQEYLRAVQDYKLTYPSLKMLARNSLSYSFLPGTNLWLQANSQNMVKACAADQPGSTHLTQACQVFLQASEKARLQWQLEEKFNQFENTIIH